MMRIDRGQIALSALLVAINVILFNLIASSWRGLRVDLSEGDVFSLSPTTERILAGLEEPLELIAFISDEKDMAEDVRPLVPEVLDLLAEYEIKGRGKLRLRRVVPEENEATEEAARRDYRIRPQLGVFRDARQQGIQSFYLSLVVNYPGTDPVTLNASDLISQNIFSAEQGLELRNVELELTKAIKKALLGFESKRNLFKKFPSKLAVTTFISPAEELPESLRDVPARVGVLLDDIAARSFGKLTHARADLSNQLTIERYRVRALALENETGKEEGKPFYLAMALEMEGESLSIPLIDIEGVRSNAWIEELIMGQVKRSSPGLLRRLGVAEHIPDPDGRLQQTGQQVPPPSFLAVVRTLDADHEVVNLDLGSLDALPADLDLLLVLEPARLDERAAYVIDQYVMGGGKAIFCLDRTDSSLISRQSEGADARDSGLEKLLATWGVELEEGVVLDPQSGSMIQDRGRGARPLEGPWYSLVEVGFDDDGVNRDVDFMKSFEAARFWFPGSLALREVAGLESRWLLRSSAQSWLRSAATGLEPDLARFPQGAFAGPTSDEKRGRRTLAAAIEGVFPSAWAGKAAPAPRPRSMAPDEDEDLARVAQEPLPASRPTRIVVIANGEFVDLVQAEYARRAGSRMSLFPGNMGFLQNAIDWLLEDDDLAAIRNRGRSFRPLARLDDEEIDRSMLWNFLTPLVLLAGLGIALTFSRRLRRPLI